MITLVSFDIDGTLELGDPPGIITIEMLRSVKRRGYLIGSGSERPVSYQRDLWKRLQIESDFTVLKHRLAEIKTRFLAHAYYHVGDTDVDALVKARGLARRAQVWAPLTTLAAEL